MGILATDIVIKTAIEAAIADLRKNKWILSDVYGDLAGDPMAATDYGYKEVERATEWMLGNDIGVYITNLVDTPRFPCITIVRTSSREMQERAALADDFSMEDIEPAGITRQNQRMTPEFTPKAYDKTKGIVTLPDSITTSAVFNGQYLVAKRSGKAYIIQHVLTSSSFQIAAGTNDDFTEAYVVPPTSLWNLQKELTFLEETFAIGMHAQSDINQALWLRQLMQYIMLRYKESYIEKRGVELSSYHVGAIDANPHFPATELVFSCTMTLVGQTEASFVKYASPKLQGTKVSIRIADGPKTPEQYQKYADAQGWSMAADE